MRVPKRLYELPSVLPELRLSQTSLPTERHHVKETGSGLRSASTVMGGGMTRRMIYEE